MNTREFLSLVLPEAGIKYLAELKTFDTNDAGTVKTVSYFDHYAFDAVPGMAGAARDLDDEGKTIYFALAGFAEPVQAVDRKTGKPKVTASGKPKMDKRTQPLAIAVKCFWADIDCSPEKAASGLGYATKKEAVIAVADFCRATGTPAPLVVDSGGGLHCYWPLTTEIRGDQWTQIAKLWRVVVQHFKLRSDAARDIDVASVLRPVGTHNRKNAGVARPVRAMNDPARVVRWSAGRWVKHISTVMKAHGLKPTAEPSKRTNTTNDDLFANSYPKSSAVQIAHNCAQILNFYNARGDVAEPVWRGALGIIKHTTEGEALAHDWSSGHPDYDYEQTQEKLDRWDVGPTTCEYFKKHASDTCEGCKHAARVKSPIQLGVVVPETPQTVELTAEPKAEAAAGAPAPTFSVELPEGFVEANGHLCRFVTDKEGIVQQVPILSTAFYIVERIYDTVAGTYSFKCIVRKATGALRSFTLPTSLAYSTKLAETLSGYEVFLMSSKSLEHVRDYFRTSITNLAERAEERSSTTAFGWDPDLNTFALGDVLYRADGTVAEVVASGNAAAKAPVLTDRRGTAQGWASAVAKVYDRHGMLSMQYTIASVFGSILAPFVPSQTYKGCLLALTSARSGLGKTTAVQFALAAFGDVEGLTVSGKQGATINALYAEMATMRNVPLLLDEYTNIDQGFASDLAYAVVQGQEKLRLDSSGTTRARRHWAMSPVITANTHIGRLLSADGSNAEAQAVRVLEIAVDTQNIPALARDAMREAEAEVKQNRGQAGGEFVAHVITHQKEIAERVEYWLMRIARESRTLSDNQYRFFCGHIACTLTALEVMNDLDLLPFSPDQVFAWAVAHCEGLASEIVENNTITPEEALNQLVIALSPQTIVTYGYGDGRQAAEDPLHPLRGEPVGRLVLGGDRVPKHMHNVLALTKTAVRKWCLEHRVDYAHITSCGEATGAVLDPAKLFGPGVGDRFSLGRGTALPAGRVRCVFLDLAVLNGEQRAQLRVVRPAEDDDRAVEATQ